MKKILVILILLAGGEVHSQYVPLYSQYMFTESIYNPAYVGLDKAFSLTGLHRSQWIGLDGGSQTTFLSAHTPLLGFLGLGLNIINDGVGPMSRQTVQFGLAYHLNLGEAKLSIGAFSGLQGLKIDLEKVNLQQVTDPSFQDFEQRFFYPILGYGIFFKNKNFSFGLSVPQIQISDNEYLKGEVHFFGNVSYLLRVSDKLGLKTSVLAMYVKGAPFQIGVNEQLVFTDKFWVGISYRSFAIVNAMVGAFLKPQIKVGLSYDYPITVMNKYTQGNIEFLLNYTMKYGESKVITPRFF